MMKENYWLSVIGYRISVRTGNLASGRSERPNRKRKATEIYLTRQTVRMVPTDNR